MGNLLVAFSKKEKHRITEGRAMKSDCPTMPLKSSSSIIPSLSSDMNLPISVNTQRESANGTEARRENNCFYNLVFGSVPSQIEVGNAIDSLQKFMRRNFPSETETNPVLAITDLSISLYHGYERVYNALSLMQTEPSVKKLVVSLSSDKAVWDAVMNSQSVQKLRESLNPGGKGMVYSYNEESDIGANIFGWILEIAMAKITMLVEKFTLLMREILQPRGGEDRTAESGVEMEENVISSLLLCIVIFFTVVVARL